MTVVADLNFSSAALIAASTSCRPRPHPGPSCSSIRRTLRHSHNTSRYRIGSGPFLTLQHMEGEFSVLVGKEAVGPILGDGNTAGIQAADPVYHLVQLHMGVAA